MIKIFKNKTQLEFCIGLHISDISLLKEISQYFGVGNFRVNKSKKVCTYSVVKLKDINNQIIPHFNKYKLQSNKRADFELLKKAVLIKINKEKEQRAKLVNLRASINRGLTPKLKEEFPLVKPFPRSNFVFDKPLNPY